MSTYSQEWDTIRRARDDYLTETLVGRWLIDLVYVHQTTLLNRANSTLPTAGDRALAQALYAKYLGEVKLALADPSRNDVRLTQAQPDPGTPHRSADRPDEPAQVPDPR